MRNLFFGIAALLAASGLCLGQNTINSMSASATQNQVLTGQSGHHAPPEPTFFGGVPETNDRVAGTPANADVRWGSAPPAPAETTSPGSAVFLPAAGQKPAAATAKAGGTATSAGRQR